MIRSSYEQLRQALADVGHDVYGLAVEYVDHTKAPMAPERLSGGMPQIVLDMLSKKSRGYSGEREFRLITDYMIQSEKWTPDLVGGYVDTDVVNRQEAAKVRVDLGALIDGIVLHPKCGEGLRGQVVQLLRQHAAEHPRLVESIETSILA